MLSTEHIFAVDSQEYGWCDVVVAAARNGAWATTDLRARLGAACVEHAAATGASLAPNVLEAVAREFRYARNLVTAHSMEQWLAGWSLSIKDWTAYLRRDAHRSRRLGEPDVLLRRYPIGAEDAARLTLMDAICSGDLDEWKRSLAARAAAASSLGPSEITPEPAEPAVPEILCPALPLLGASIDDLREAARRVQRMDDAFERFRKAQITDAAVSDYVGRRQLEWLQFDCRVMAFPEEDMAAEAALLLREDGEGFTGVYTVARAEPRVARFFLDDVPESARDEFLAAQAGDLVGPMRLGNEHALYLIREKLLPSPRDPEVRQRAEEGVLQHALRQQLDRRVRWLADSK
jgi:hypothetical protein